MLTITRAKLFTSCVLAALSLTARAEDWKVDLSRRFPEPKKEEMRDPASSDQPVSVDGGSATGSFFDAVFKDSDPAQEIVVLNTEKGFIPSQIRVRQGQNYKIYVVNVNEAEKNVSFVLDSFSEHHATYYGKIKSFMIHPQKEGVYKFISPETSAQGKLVVAPEEKNGRLPASP
jgi:hypothetical protein